MGDLDGVERGFLSVVSLSFLVLVAGIIAFALQ
jgi:hypothetical protein